MVSDSVDNTRGDGSAKRLSISVFFPCYNEQDNVAVTVEKALSVLDNLDADYEILIVNDGSTDNTAMIADGLAGKYAPVKALHHPANLGYGAALQTGFKNASKNLVFYTDGDGQFDIAEMPALLWLMDDYDIVSCYRINRQDNIIRKINGFCWTKLVCILFGLKLKDIDCAFKLYKTKIFDNIKMSSTGALIDAEILARAAKKGYTITQRPVKHFPREAGEQTGADIKVILRAFKELLKLHRDIKRGN